MTSLREAAQMALDAATEELPKVDERETVFCSIQGHHLRALCEFVRAALAQPEPEPVAWLTDREEMYFDKEDARRYSDGFIQPLYPAPTKREWVGLTDDEITDSLINRPPSARLSHLDAARAIEARLKEKNT